MCLVLTPGLADPWATNNKEELPSYDDIAGGAIADPWASSTSTAPPQLQALPTQPVPLVDPWGFSPSAAAVPPYGSAIPAQPQANPE